MDNRDYEQRNGATQGRGFRTGPSNYYLTLLRKNRDVVSISMVSGQKLRGVIAGFDETGIIINSTNELDPGELYASRLQITTIIPESPVAYLKETDSRK